MEFDVVQTLDCDVAVIGGGGAGMVAYENSYGAIIISN
jgi:hypothetical protein